MNKKSSPGKSKRLVIGRLLAKFRFAGAKPAAPKRKVKPKPKSMARRRPKPKPKVNRGRRRTLRPKR